MKLLLSVLLLLAVSSTANAHSFIGGYGQVGEAGSASSVQGISGSTTVGNGYAWTGSEAVSNNSSGVGINQNLGVTNVNTYSTSTLNQGNAAGSHGNATAGSLSGASAGGYAEGIGGQGFILTLP